MDQNLVATIVAAGMFILFVVGLVLLRKLLDQKEEQLSKFVNTQAIKERAGYLLIFLVGLCISEGMFAGTIEVQGKEMNVVARMMGHTVFSLIGVIMVIGVPDLIIDLIEHIVEMVSIARSKTKTSGNLGRKEWLILFSKVILLITLSIAGVWFPYINVLIIGKGLNESVYVELAWYESFWFFHPFFDLHQYAEYLSRQDPTLFPGWDPPNEEFSAFDYMSYPMVASYRLFQAHIIISFIDGLIAAIDRLEGNRISRKDLNTKLTSKLPDVQTDEIMEDIQNPLMKLVRYTELYKKKSKGMDKVGSLEGKFLELDTKTQVKLAGRIGRLVGKVNNLEKEKDSTSLKIYNAKKRALQNEIKEFFATSTKNGRGFGEPLSKKYEEEDDIWDEEGN